MNWRFFSVALVMMLALVTDLWLVSSEEIVEVEGRQSDTRRADPLFSMRFAPDQREANLRAMGFDDAETKAVLRLMDGMATRYQTSDPSRNVLLARIRDASDLDALIVGLCGVGATGMAGSPLPVRYHAMKFIVAEEGAGRKAISPEGDGFLEYQEAWVPRSRLDSVYEEAELVPERKADATRMALAAILAGKNGEDAFLRGDEGWGNGLFGIGGWSWDRVRSTHPGVADRVQEYVALMHLVAEQAHSPDGICGSEDAPEPAPAAPGAL